MIRFSSATRCGSAGRHALLVVLTVLSVNLATCPLVSAGTEYTAQFVEAGGLAAGDDVTVGAVQSRLGAGRRAGPVPGRRSVPGDHRPCGSPT